MLLEVKDLSVSYPGFELHPMSLGMEEGEILGVVGESGSGKTTLAKALSCLLGKEAQCSGSVILDGHELLGMKEKDRKKLRMSLFSVAFQSSVEYLNPSMSLKVQLREILDRKYPRAEQDGRMRSLMEQVGLKYEDIFRFPRELSGGMVQKFLLACAIALSPKFVILDEPTSSLDFNSAQDFAGLIKKINSEQNIAFLMITHDMKMAEMLCGRIMVIYEGHVMEEGTNHQIIGHPRHPYTRGLLHASISLNIAKDIWGIPNCEEDYPHHCCPFYGRCTQAIELCTQRPPRLEKLEDGRSLACHRGGIVTVLEGQHISKAYGEQQVLSDCSIKVRSGEVISLVGKSGVGKTTLARILSGFDETEFTGRLLFEGEDADFAVLHKCRGGIQMVFQDSEASLNPRMTVFEAVSEPLLLNKAGEEEIEAAVTKALRDVGLPAGSFREKRIKVLSGGQKQRVSLARALSMEPKLLIADEPTAMLDPSSRANVLRMLKSMQNERGLSMLIISHDLDSAAKISDSIYLLKDKSLRSIHPSAYVSSRLNTLL